MIDPATRWFQMARINQKDAYTVADIVDHPWFMLYPWPTTVIVDRGKEFLADFTEIIQKDFGATKRLSPREIRKQTQLLNAYIKLS